MVKHSGYPDQTGVERANETVRLSAKQGMVKWMQKRGRVGSEMYIVWDEPSFLPGPEQG